MAQKYCSHCGESLKEYAIVCSDCGAPVKGQKQSGGNTAEENVHAEPVGNSGKTQSAPMFGKEKSTFFALILSFFMSGLGQVYNGNFWKGVGFMIAATLGWLLIIPGLVIWIWNMYDAYTDAEKINRGELPFKEPTVWEIIAFLLLPFIVGAVFVFFLVIFAMAIFVPFSYAIYSMNVIA
ncbi:MAG: zinc-ribbon domain-containing protein [Methanosarcinales archaeon]|jgi:TM2 domain-containing membrane protein YozV|nr:zinc-ribbon domain-containing protein [Methanosarcinales archaeon]